MPIKITLVSSPTKEAIPLMSFAGSGCYKKSQPSFGKLINIKERIYNPGHHQVMEPNSYSWFIEGIAVGDVNFGVHLHTPHYSTSQRSGRFCNDMYIDPNALDMIIQYIKFYYPQTEDNTITEIMQYINTCIDMFKNHIEPATRIAESFINRERPKANDEYVQKNAKKFATEQLRAGMSVIYPTGLTYSVNLLVLVNLYQSAWSPVMYHLTELMANDVLKKNPELAYMFKRREVSSETISDFHQALVLPDNCKLSYSPTLRLLSMDSMRTAVYPEPEDVARVNMLTGNPKFMPNNVLHLKTGVVISLMTKGQDERHRRYDRGLPELTGGVYIPPIVAKLGLSNDMLKINEMWLSFKGKVHPALFISLAPYSAMVKYIKDGNLNTVLHEQQKRTCWCAQEEIYKLALQLRLEISRHPNCTDHLLSLLAPGCKKFGHCVEGDRYCGRDLDITNHFIQREV